MFDGYADWLRHYKTLSGDLRPPWQILDCHPHSIHWRMGTGESYLAVWHQWWTDSHFTTDERVSYFKRWAIANPWLPFIARSIWDTDTWNCLDEEQRTELVEKLDAVDIASRPLHSIETTVEARIFQQKLRYGEFPPPWVYEEERPDHLVWRLRGGKTLLEDWQHWWNEQKFTQEERIRYFKRWPMEASWLDFAIANIWSPAR